MLHRGLLLALVGCWTCCSAAIAEDAFFRVQLSEMKFVDGELPNYQAAQPDWRVRQRVMQTRPDVQLDEAGEAYLQQGDLWSSVWDWSRQDRAPQVHVVIRAEARKDVAGRIVMPKPDGNGMVALKFRLAAESANPNASRDFQFAKIEHYERRLQNSPAGAAWYRHQVGVAMKELGALSNQEGSRIGQVARQWNGNRNPNDMDRTYELFSGGRAISENLQLDREMLFPRGNTALAKPVLLDSITGITVKEIDWQPLLKDAKPVLDSLAGVIPADQHVVFFPTFAAALKVADESKQQGTAILRRTELDSQDTHLIERYEKQLGLSLSVLGRMLGPKFVSSVAITGGDPYFATGTDVAVLFETRQPSVLASLLQAKVRLEAAEIKDAKQQGWTVEGLKYWGISSPDRRVCSYIAELENAVVVTNSLAQLQRLAAVIAGKQPAMSSLPEYAFFRQRYQLGDASESALLFISDATIRRWCGPRWRIASSRRTRDAAVLTQMQAASLDFLVTGKGLKLGSLVSDLPTSQQADLQLTTDGVMSPSLGRLDFLTPISELTFDSVTTSERDAYQRWRDNYQNNWNAAFDPIALRIGSDEKRLTADLSIMPLIVRSEYRTYLQVATGVKLTAESGDPHDTIAHFVLALNRESEPIQQLNRLLAGFLSGNRPAGLGGDRVFDPLGWLGTSMAVYADRDPYWQELLKLNPQERGLKLQQDGFRLPIGVRFEVRDPLKLALFLTTLRGFIQQAAPGITKWDNPTHRDQAYVKISPARPRAIGTDELDNAALYYAIIGDGLLFSPNEGVIQRAIDRHLDRDEKVEPAKDRSRTRESSDRSLTTSATTSATPPADGLTAGWLGESVGLKLDHVLPQFFLWYVELSEPELAAQQNSWSNLAILNEWKRRYPDRDPVEVHRRYWNTELVCPGGGKYVWNEQWRTMESTVFGHPSEPKMPEKFEAPLVPFSKASFGLTFELDGLRSRLELLREGK